MKIVLAQEEVKLRESEAATNAMLGKLEVSSMEAKKEADIVAVKLKKLAKLTLSVLLGRNLMPKIWPRLSHTLTLQSLL